MITLTKTNLKTSAALVLAAFSIALSAFAVINTESGLQTAATSSAVSYYIGCDALSGDSNNGTSAATAWKTFARLDQMQGVTGLKAGDQIYLQRGCTFKEILQIAASGSAGSLIGVDAYGSGNNPVIDGEQTRPWNVLVMNQSYISIKNINVINARSESSPSAGLVVYNSSNVAVDGVTALNNWGYGGIYFLADIAGTGNNNTVKNSVVSGTKGTAYSQTNAYNYGAGIIFYADGADRGLADEIFNNQAYGNGAMGISFSGSGGSIKNNTVYNNGDAGIGLYAATTIGNVVEHNTAYGNCRVFDDRAGINLFMTGSNNIIRYNKVYGQYDTYNNPEGLTIIIDQGNNGQKLGTQGIRFDGSANGVTETSGNAIIYNVIYGEGDGIQIYNFSNVAVYNNTVYNSKRFGLVLGGAITTGAQVKNNIFSTMAAGGTFGNYKTLLGIIEAANNAINYNLYYPSGSYTKPAGQDANSLVLDPQFSNVAAFDFSLQSASPAINKGVALGLTPDYGGLAVPQGTAPDMGAYEFGGTLPPVCVESWSCADWSVCSGGTQTRTCVDSNNCGTTDSKPAVSQTCVCTPTTCAAQGKNCGSISNGCGGTLSCGTCNAAQNCVSNLCVVKTCTSSACCKAKNPAYPYYSSLKKKCCKSMFSSSCIAR
ncbi:MAG: right-handed parallel beta-helix repeat-containing protein [Candidatus Buchananbacteria bacterium]